MRSYFSVHSAVASPADIYKHGTYVVVICSVQHHGEFRSLNDPLGRELTRSADFLDVRTAVLNFSLQSIY